MEVTCSLIIKLKEEQDRSMMMQLSGILGIYFGSNYKESFNVGKRNYTSPAFTLLFVLASFKHHLVAVLVVSTTHNEFIQFLGNRPPNKSLSLSI